MKRAILPTFFCNEMEHIYIADADIDVSLTEIVEPDAARTIESQIKSDIKVPDPFWIFECIFSDLQ